MSVRSRLYRGLNHARWRMRDPYVLGVRRLEERSQWWTPDQIQFLQSEALQRLIQHAYQHVPYYRTLMKSNGLAPGDFKTVDDLVKLPILDKQTFSSRWEEFVPDGIDAAKLPIRRTGGTTGQPLRVARDPANAAFENAAFYRGLGFAGYKQGDKIVKLFGGTLGMAPVGSLERLKTRFSGEIFLPAFESSRANVGEYVDAMRDGRARFLRGYASGVHLLASWMKEADLKFELDAVFTTADMLYEPQRQLIAEQLGDVFEYYGCGEVNSIAFECTAHDGLHISDEHVLLEAMKDGQPASEGDMGAVTLTTLRNYTMPLIRYQNGDVVALTGQPCSCGRGLSRIAKLFGRTNDLLLARDGRLINGVFLPAFLVKAAMKGVRQIQVIQETQKLIRLLVVTSTGYSGDSLDPLRDVLVRYLGDVTIGVELVDSIPTSPMGKGQYVISKVVGSL